jgi:hypothetical protein
MSDTSQQPENTGTSEAAGTSEPAGTTKPAGTSEPAGPSEPTSEALGTTETSGHAASDVPADRRSVPGQESSQEGPQQGGPQQGGSQQSGPHQGGPQQSGFQQSGFQHGGYQHGGPGQGSWQGAPRQQWWNRRVPLVLTAAALALGCVFGAGVTAVGALVVSDGHRGGDRVHRSGDYHGPKANGEDRPRWRHHR